MIEKSILNRIKKLETRYPTLDFDVEEYTNNLIEELEMALRIWIKRQNKITKETLLWYRYIV